MSESPATNWPHAPLHRLTESGAYLVTAGTYGKQHHFRFPDRLDMLQYWLFRLADEHRLHLEAWALFSNHYHFVTILQDPCDGLNALIKQLHAKTALEANRLDRVVGRKVWYQYWDSHITFERSYLARLNNVHQNPVKHGLVRLAAAYQWCSAGWFEAKTSPAFFRTVSEFKTDSVNVIDTFEPMFVQDGGVT